MSGRSHRTVDRVVGIVELVARSRGGMTLTQLARELDAPKSSIQGLVYGLEATGYLIVTEGRYRLGPVPYMLTLAADSPTWALPSDAVADLAERVGCSTQVGVRCGDYAVYVDQHFTNPLLDFYATHRVQRPLLTTAVGKCLLAFGDRRSRDDFLVRRSESDRRLVDKFLIELPAVRERGYTVNRSESIEGIDAIPAPVLGRRTHFDVGPVVGLAWPSGSRDESEIAGILLATIASWNARP